MDHFVSSSPVTLLCSLRTESSELRERDPKPGLLHLFSRTLKREVLKRFAVIIVKDLLPLLLSQIFLSTYATVMRPLEKGRPEGTDSSRPMSLPGLSVYCPTSGAWDFTFLPYFAVPSSVIALFIPPTHWRKSAAKHVGDPMGFFLLSLYAFVLLLYALYANLWVNRHPAFPRAVRRSIWRKILTVQREKAKDRMKVLVILLHLENRERQAFLLKLLSAPKKPTGKFEMCSKLFGNRETRDDIVKTQLKKMEWPSEVKREEEINRSFKGSEFKDQLSHLKDQVFPLFDNDQELSHLVAALFTRPYEQRFDKVHDRDLLLMLDLFNVPLKYALAQPESHFGGQVVSTGWHITFRKGSTA